MPDGGGDKRRPLTPVRALTRTVLGVDYEEARYEVEVDFFNLGKDAALYRDSRLVQRRRTPARFTLGDGAGIEVATSMYGIKRARLTTPDGHIPMQPSPETWEYKRIRWHESHPRAGRVIGVVSWTILAVAAILGIPQLLELASTLLTETDVGQTAGLSLPFTSPIELPGEANAAITVLAVAAALERATRLKYSWWLDG